MVILLFGGALMKKRFISMICSAAMLLTAVFMPFAEGGLSLVSAADTTVLNFDVTYHQTEARSMLSMINEWRKSDDAWAWNEGNTEKVYYTGLTDLVYDYDLEKVAMQRAAEIAVDFDHTRPDGSSCYTAFPSVYSSKGENIAWGTNLSSVEKAFLLWREDDYKYDGQGHRRNMLGGGSGLKAIGIACVQTGSGYFWVQEFGSPAKNVTATAANDSSSTVSVEVINSLLENHPEVLTYYDYRPVKNMYSGGQTYRYDLLWGEEDELPQVYLNREGLRISSPVNATWSIVSGTSVTLSGNTVKAVGDGETLLQATYNGLKTDTYSVKVAHFHKYNSKPDRIVKDSTCTVGGVGEFDCTICGHTTTYSLTAYGHSYWSFNHAPTCTEQGYTEHYCIRCGDTYNTDYVSALGHTPTATAAKAATCTTAGNTAYWYCSTCKKYFSDSACTKEITLASTVIPATGHKTTATTAKAATCTTAGNTAYWYCSTCKKYFSDSACTKEITLASTVIPATGHKTTATEAKAATCTTAGNTAYWYCSTCKKYFSDSACTKEITLASTVIPATGHKTTATAAKAATCTTAGNSAYWYCSTCKKYFSDSVCTKETTLASTVIPATGHKTTATPAKAATCTTAGNTAYWYCSTCKKYFSDSACTKETTLASTVIPATAHKYTDTVVAPTTEQKGYTLHKCTVCGHEYIDTYTDPLPKPTRKKGDISNNGRIDAADLLQVKSHIKKVKLLTGDDFWAADIDDNKVINAADLLKIKSHIKGVSLLWS